MCTKKLKYLSLFTLKVTLQPKPTQPNSIQTLNNTQKMAAYTPHSPTDYTPHSPTDGPPFMPHSPDYLPPRNAERDTDGTQPSGGLTIAPVPEKAKRRSADAQARKQQQTTQGKPRDERPIAYSIVIPRVFKNIGEKRIRAIVYNSASASCSGSTSFPSAERSSTSCFSISASGTRTPAPPQFATSSMPETR